MTEGEDRRKVGRVKSGFVREQRTPVEGVSGRLMGGWTWLIWGVRAILARYDGERQV